MKSISLPFCLALVAVLLAGCSESAPPSSADAPLPIFKGGSDLTTQPADGDRPAFNLLYQANLPAIAQLAYYDSPRVAGELGGRIATEPDGGLKFLYAYLSAERGGAVGRTFLLEQRQSTQYETVRNDLAALEQLAMSRRSPDWAVAALTEALKDQRPLIGAPASLPSGTVASLAKDEMDVPLHLGSIKAASALPTLIELARESNGDREYVAALGAIGDPAAVPVLVALFEAHARDLGGTEFQAYSRIRAVVDALAQLRARDAVPALLAHLRYPVVIDALGSIGDKRATEPIRKIVHDDGHLPGVEAANTKIAMHERLLAGRIALVLLEQDDPTPGLCAMLEDPIYAQSDSQIVGLLRDRGTPAAVMCLAKAIRTTDRPALANYAVAAIAAFETKAAVEALIDSFDVRLPVPADGKTRYTQSAFQMDLADALRDLTGESFGTDKDAWRKWWNEAGKKDPRFAPN
ncbi:MAG: hypothetical protein WD042_17310 [Phycisphaeraceae bacterium]